MLNDTKSDNFSFRLRGPSLSPILRQPLQDGECARRPVRSGVFSLIISPGFESSLRASKKKKKEKLRPNLYFPPPPRDSLPCRFDPRIYTYVCVQCADGFFFRSVTLLRRFRPLRAPAPGALTCVSASRTPVRPPRPSRA